LLAFLKDFYKACTLKQSPPTTPGEGGEGGDGGDGGP